MRYRNDITAEYVRSILDYDPEMGVFTWKWRENMRLQWNARFSGKIAGRIDRDGYIVICIDYISYKAHRLAVLHVSGEWPCDLVDHENTNTSANNFSNLRAATPSQNNYNATKRSSNTSGYKGVTWHSKDKKWQAQIQVNKKNIYLGQYATPQDAHLAYCRAASLHHGNFARTS